MKTPTELRVATALSFLGLVRFPILLSSQRFLLLSRTRQDAVVRGDPVLSSPPQVAMTGLSSDVKNVTWWISFSGRCGTKQPRVLG